MVDKTEVKQVEELARALCNFSANTICPDCADDCFFKEYARRAVAKGWCRQSENVIELPCKVGDKVYYIPFGKTIEECIVHAVEYEEKAIVIKCHIWSKEREALLHKHLVYFNDNDFGETVFLTREEAEAKMKGGGE